MQALIAVFFTLIAAPPAAHFQAHRGGLDEVPENTLAALRHAWAIPGAVPEVDVRVTADGALVLLHDATLARTTDAPEAIRDIPIERLDYAALAKLDAGAWFDPRFVGERIPTLDAAFVLLAEDGGRRLYLDIKDTACLDAVEAAIAERGVQGRILFVHGDPRVCAQLRNRFDAPTMTWISGSERAIKRRFAELAQSGFAGIDQLQFHLRGEKTERGVVYELDEPFLREAVSLLKDAGVALQLRPFVFDGPSLARLLDMGVEWYVADAPAAFAAALSESAALRGEGPVGSAGARDIK